MSVVLWQHHFKWSRSPRRRVGEARAWPVAGRVVGLAVILGSLSARPAQASTVTLFLDAAFASTENTGSAARIVLSFTEDGFNDLLSVTIENTTPPEIDSSLTAVGLELPPALGVVPVLATGGEGAYFDTLTYDVNLSPDWLNAPGGYDLVLSSDGNLLGGSPQGAPRAGESDTVRLNLGDTPFTSAELAGSFRGFYTQTDHPVVFGRFQAVGPDQQGSDKVGGFVPEPATLVLLVVSSLMILPRGRRR